LPPTNTYKIQLEQIKSTQTDDATKDLASQLVTLTRKLESVVKAIEKGMPEGSAKEKVHGIDIALKRFESFVDVASKLNNSVDKLAEKMSKLPDSIKDAVGSIKDTAIKIKTEGPVASAPEIVDVVKMLTSAYKNVKESETYKVGREGILKDLEKLINELMKRDKSIEELTSTLKDVHKLVGTKPEAAKPATTYTSIKGVQLLGRELNDLGVEFEKIKNELQDKIVVAIDLETSSIKGKDAKKLQGITTQEDIISLVVKKTEPSIEGSLYDELDLVEINFIGDYYDSISKSDLTDVKKK
jgi:seryl-tRNA synthetase